MNESVTKVFVEQPMSSPGSAKYTSTPCYLPGLDTLGLQGALIIMKKKNTQPNYLDVDGPFVK